MAWTPPRTWIPGETVTASLGNVHWRDNLNLLKTYVDDDGSLRTFLKGFAFSTGQGNAAGGADTQLSSYNVTIPANYLSQPGDGLVIEGKLNVLNNADSKTCKIQVASGTLNAIFNTTGAVANHVVPFRVVLRRRTSTTGSLIGYAHQGAADAGAATVFLVDKTVASVDWTTSQVLKIFASGNTVSDVTLTDYSVENARGLSGVTI